jgi:hypothetical protein
MNAYQSLCSRLHELHLELMIFLQGLYQLERKEEYILQEVVLIALVLDR